MGLSLTSGECVVDCVLDVHLNVEHTHYHAKLLNGHEDFCTQIFRPRLSGSVEINLIRGNIA